MEKPFPDWKRKERLQDKGKKKNLHQGPSIKG